MAAVQGDDIYSIKKKNSPPRYTEYNCGYTGRESSPVFS